MNKRSILCGAVLMLFTASTFAVEPDSIRVAKYKGNKDCAISYTFDDGLKEQYTIAVPKLEEYGFRGTFCVNGAKINEDANHVTDTSRMTWDDLKDMSERGHEISNHGWAHRNHGRFTIEEIREDIYKDDSVILAMVGVMPRTFCYPNNTKTKEGVKLASENRVGTRLEQRSIGSKRTPEDLRAWVTMLIEAKDWGVGMTHGINYGYDAFRNPQVLWDHFKDVKSQEDKIWVGTLEEVCAYTKERDEVMLKTEVKKKEILVTPQLSLDQTLFTQPLTLVVYQKGVKNAAVKQDGRVLETRIGDGMLVFDFNPWGGVISIRIK